MQNIDYKYIGVLMNSLNRVRQYLNSIPNIHKGGCGIAALAMYRWLKKNEELNDNTHVVYFFNEDAACVFFKNHNYLETKKGKPTSCNHAGIFHKNHYLDCSKEFFENNFDYNLFVDEQFVVKSLNNITAWSKMFDRENVIPFIEYKLQIDLSDILVKQL